MLKTNITEIEFVIDKYVDISDFSNLIYSNDSQPCVIAVIAGIIEGVIQLNKEESNFIALGMYKIKCNNNFMLFNIHNTLKNNDEFYKYIVNYFNLWHGRQNEVFTYDYYNKKDLKQNFDFLVEILYNELKTSKLNDNMNEFYQCFLDTLCNMLSTPASY